MPFCTAMCRVGKFNIFVSDPFVEWNHMILARKNNGFFVTLSCAFYHMTHQCFSNALFLELRIDVQSENHLIITVRVVQRGVMVECIRQIIGIRTAAIAEACDFAVFSFRYKKAVFAGFVPLHEVFITCRLGSRET